MGRVTDTLPTRAWQELEEAVAGEVVRAGTAGYDVLRRSAIPRFDDVRPAAVVLCDRPDDVAAALAFARAAGLPVAVRSGGRSEPIFVHSDRNVAENGLTPAPPGGSRRCPRSAP